MKSYTAKLGTHGRVVIPIACRKQLALNIGDDLIFTIENNELRMLSAKQAVAKIQDTVQKLSKGKSLVDELIAVRRQEALRE